MDSGNDKQQSVYLYILERIERQQADGFHSVEAKLATKADKADISRLELRLTEHDRVLQSHDSRLVSVEESEKFDRTTEQVRQAAQARWRKIGYSLWVIMTTVAIILATAGVIHF